jgi:hypothetical protein
MRSSLLDSGVVIKVACGGSALKFRSDRSGVLSVVGDENVTVRINHINCISYEENNQYNNEN